MYETQSSFIDKTLTCFEQAVEASGNMIERSYGIGGCEIQIAFAGKSMVQQICPAIEHLSVQAVAQPMLRVVVWDRGSTGVALPPPPWTEDDLLPRGEIRGFNHGSVLAQFMGGTGSFSLLSMEQNLAVVWAPESKALPHHEKSFPLRTILHWWLPTCGTNLIHAGAVGRPSGGVLFAGKGGSGKSTSALACLHSDLLYAGDDYTLISAGTPPYVHSLYSTGKVWAHDIHRLPHLADHYRLPDFPESEKVILYLHEHFPEKLIAGFPLRAILVPTISKHGFTALREASGAESIKALAPSTIFQLPGAGQAVFELIARLAKQIPTYVLELGADVRDVPVAVSELLDGLP